MEEEIRRCCCCCHKRDGKMLKEISKWIFFIGMYPASKLQKKGARKE